MHLFRVRLILALIAGVTLISVASTYFDVLAHKHTLRVELTRRTRWMGMSIERDVAGVLESSDLGAVHGLTEILKSGTGALALAVYDGDGKLLACSGPQDVLQDLPYGLIKKSMKNGAEVSQFGHTGKVDWFEEALPLHDGDKLEGVVSIVSDAGYIRSEGIAVWQRSFLRILALVVLIVAVTLGMVSWFLFRPIEQVAEHLRRLRLKSAHPVRSSKPHLADLSFADLKLFKPLAREVETIAESLRAARAAAATEARLRDAGEHVWTAERLAAHMRRHSGSSSIFVVSNREPYMHVRQGREVKCVVPPSGLVTAIEPILQACDGVWVASGSGNADAMVVDNFNRIRVPPDDPRYTLRRVWLTEEEEAQYYDGFSNEGLWPLCHIAHTRPIFRAADWDCYQRVNARFANALLEEMEGSTDPIVFVQDYHFALLPRLVKAVRPDARVAIFWHIPWPNPEAFGICPWQNELLDGLLGADLIGFHIPLHCSNFLASVDRALEARTDREHMTVLRNGHQTTVRPYPISVAFDGPLLDMEDLTAAEVELEDEELSYARDELLKEFGVRGKTVLLGVDRMDYTKGIIERLNAIENLFEEHPWYRERVTMVQIAAPSRTRIASYADLGRNVEETVEHINRRFQTSHWKPVVLIDRQASHEEVSRWYRIADVCVVTSLHDGMNLVAKEYGAAREDERGVLVLSKFTGAAVELQDALVVNPYDIEGVAEAIHQALEMSRDEGRQRMRRMRRQVMEHNIYRWAANVLGDLREVRIEQVDQTPENHRVTPISIPA
jgi:alpha,alpha-trehalose-phosphate synthase [UDP-forming]